MKIKTRLKKYPKIAWGKLNVSGIMNAVAFDMASSIRKRIRGNKVMPITRHKRKDSKFPNVTLMDTGLLVKNIKNKLSNKKNTAVVYINDEKYKQENKKQKVGRAKRSGKFQHLVTTNEVATIHEDGLGRNPKRHFFYATDDIDSQYSDTI